MKLQVNIKNTFIEITSLLYILLFVYAAVSKLIDFENFKTELAQSPLLSAFAGWISWAVLFFEVATALLISFTKTRLTGLYFGFCLMTMFSAYIFIILNYSSFIPCSCGGILEKMSWNQHLVFNLIFVLIGAIALFKKGTYNKISYFPSRIFTSPLKLLMTFLLCISLMVILFISSEEIIQHQNPFIRRYPHHPITLDSIVDLKFNSYYFAGAGNQSLYLGNSTTPLKLLSIDNNLNQKRISIKVDPADFKFKSIKTAVRPPYFYIVDSWSPAFFTGSIDNWKAELKKPRPPYFNIAVPMDSSSFVFRGISSSTSNNVLGIFRIFPESKIIMAPDLLEKQIDGVFDTDGMLHYSSKTQNIVYIYTYRNQYIVADKNGQLIYRGNTIDTISKAAVKVVNMKNNTERAMSAPTLNVNKTSSVFGSLLFVNSNIPGRYEQKQVWKQASVIDIYDLRKKSYLFSFHIYGINGRKLRDFMVTQDFVFALIGSELAVYKINKKLSDAIRKTEDK